MEPVTSTVVEEAAARRAGDRGLSWFNFFVANIQTGFGPFVAVYLTTQGWTMTSIGIALSVGTVTSLVSQLPAGALVDAVRSKVRVAGFSVGAFMASALLLALSPLALPVYIAKVLHGFSSCTLGPSIAAMSLRVAGHAGLGERLGRNARYASLGSGVGAALMGACGYYVSEQAVFYLTALLALPAIMALGPLGRATALPPPPDAREPPPAGRTTTLKVLGDRRLLAFAACAMLFTFVNAPLLPIASSALTASAGSAASLIIAACIVLPQVVVAIFSPSVGRYAGVIGRKPLLLLGFLILPIRAAALSLTTDPALVVLLQALDGIAAACFGVLVPLIVSDIAARSGHFNLSLGAIGLAVGIGGSISPPLAGWVADQAGQAAAFAMLAVAGVVALAFVRFAMPETRPADPAPRG